MTTDVVASTVSVRLLDQWHELEAAAGVVLKVWGEAAVALASAALLRTYSHYGNPVIGAFEGDRLCGVSIGFLAPAPTVHLHSHITGVLPTHQHLGVGFHLKSMQRQWCVDHGIDLVSWTFDPMLARNAHFNLRKLGARSLRFHPGFYGVMDDDINRGDDTDRLEISWIVAESGTAVARREIVRTVAVPTDYLALRAEDPVNAAGCRATVREQLVDAFDAGLEIVDFERGRGYCFASAASA